MAIEDIKNRVEEVSRRVNAANKTKSELLGQLEARKAELASLCEEIKAQGYDPKNLRAQRDQVEAELLVMLDSCETELAEVEQALAAFKK